MQSLGIKKVRRALPSRKAKSDSAITARFNEEGEREEATRSCGHWDCDVLECSHSSLRDSVRLYPEVTRRRKQKPKHRKARRERPSLAGLLYYKKSSAPDLRNPEALQAASTDVHSQQLAVAAAAVRGSVEAATSSQRNKSEPLEGDSDFQSSNTFQSCHSTSSSFEFKRTVHKLELSDTAGNAGLYSGALDTRTNRPHGQGTMVYTDVIYEGQWVDGDWCGFGKLASIETGDVYQGGFFDNMKHGLGVLKYADGRVYDGLFAFDKSDGKGHYNFPDGGRYWGNWDNHGVPHGRGKLQYPNGDVYDGEFDQGELQGHGRMTYADGHWYLGEWSEGQRNGLGMEVTGRGELVFEGMYSKGKSVESASFPHTKKSSGEFLLYRSSVAYHSGTLVGALPRQVRMRKQNAWAKLAQPHHPHQL